MSNPPSVRELGVTGKNVVVRMDLEWTGENCLREKVTREIIRYLQEKGAKGIKVIGHKGKFEMAGVEVVNDVRKDEREMQNDSGYAQELGEGWDVYVNEAFAESHRAYASVNALPIWMKGQGKLVCVGMRFAKEIENLDKVRNSFGKKALVIGGAKGDKEEYAKEFEKQGWKVLRGGLLPGVGLRPDGLDISAETATNYKTQIANAQIIVVAGPMGKYEVAEKGTREVFTAVAESKAYKVVGGGDTEAALAKFGLTEKFDWISVGGGAMLEYLVKGTLPGIEALL